MKHLIPRMFPALFAALLLLTPAMAADQEVAWGEPYALTPADLSLENGCVGAVITNVPEKSLGDLRLGSRKINAGDVLTSEQLSSLTFVPAEGATGEDQIACLAISEDGIGQEAQMTLKIGSGKNEAPTAEDSEFETYKNIPGQVSLKVSDPEDDPLTVNITKEPKRGTLELSQDGTVTYTPNENKVGKDSFTYTVTDTAGNTSGEATVRIKIQKPSDKSTYGDMEGDNALLAAVWLREHGIYEGETVSGQLLFHPEETLSRGEFIAMCVGLTNHMEDQDVLKTGFTDEAETPQWLSPYVSTALKCGYITGVPTEAGLALQADQTISQQEAAVIVSNMLSLPQPDTEAVMALEETVPAWAAGAVEAVREAGLFETVDAASPLTRREAAMLLYQSWQAAKGQESSLLSWAKE